MTHPIYSIVRETLGYIIAFRWGINLQKTLLNNKWLDKMWKENYILLQVFQLFMQLWSRGETTDQKCEILTSWVFGEMSLTFISCLYYPLHFAVLPLYVSYLSILSLCLFALFLLTLNLSTYLVHLHVCISSPLYPSLVSLQSPTVCGGEKRCLPPCSWLNCATEKESILFNERDERKGVLVNHHMVYKLNK